MQLREQDGNLVISNHTLHFRIFGAACLGLAWLLLPSDPEDLFSFDIIDWLLGGRFYMVMLAMLAALGAFLAFRPMTIEAVFDLRKRSVDVTRTALFYRWHRTIPYQSVNAITGTRGMALLHSAKLYLKDGTTLAVADAPFPIPDPLLELVREDTGINGWMFS